MKLYPAHYYGIVQDINDPENRGRILVLVPEVFGRSSVPVQASPRGQFSGRGYGSQLMPRVGDWVIVSFRNGSYEAPYWELSHYALGDKPEDLEDPTTIGLVTPNGTKVIIQDKEERVNITLPSGTELELKEEELNVKSGTITLSAGGKGKVEVTDKEIKIFDETTVKGETLQGLLEDLVEAFLVCTVVPSPAGPLVLDPGTLTKLSSLLVKFQTSMLAKTS